MDDKEQKFKTYRSLSDMHRFRLRLFAEGILTGILAGIVISFFRFALSEIEYLRGALYNRLWVSDWSINACWFAVLITIAFILQRHSAGQRSNFRPDENALAAHSLG